MLDRITDANITPPRSQPETQKVETRTIYAMTAIGVVGTALFLGWLCWAILRVLPDPEQLLLDIPSSVAGVVFTFWTMTLLRITQVWK